MSDYKKISKSGSLSVPIAIRRELSILPGDPLELETMQDGSIVLRAYTPRCTFCATTESVQVYMGKGVCRSCVDSINRKGGGADETA